MEPAQPVTVVETCGYRTILPVVLPPRPVAAQAGTEWIAAIHCSDSMCLASDNAGNILEADMVDGSAFTWKSTVVDPGHIIWSMACPSASSFVAVDNDGNAIVRR